jgi:hypothetical protein
MPHSNLSFPLCFLSRFVLSVYLEFWPSHGTDPLSICPWFPTLVGFGFILWKCLANPCLALFSINGHSLIWCPILWQYVQHGEFGLGTLFTLWIPWNSFNYASIMLIKFGFIVSHFYSHMNTLLLVLFLIRP